MTELKCKPKMVKSESQKEIDKVQDQLDAFESNVQAMTLDRMNTAAKKEYDEPHISQKEIEKSSDIYLKPRRSISSREKFNEKFRDDYNFSTELVRFIAENKEIIGETIELWTKPFPGMPAQEWVVPVNKPVWGPRHLAERLTKCEYHRFVMKDGVTAGIDMAGQYYGAMAVDTINKRLDAHPVSARKSVFMGASGF